MSKEQECGTDICPYNEGVACREPKMCGKCGWNPEVMEARKATIAIKIKEGTL